MGQLTEIEPTNPEVEMRFLGALLLAMSLTICGVSAEGPSATVLYVANEGFLITVGEHKILIDALFDDRTIGYCHVPDETTLTRMQTAEAPFDDVDVILATHYHRDHFGTTPVFQRLTNDPSSAFVGPPQAIGKLRSVAPELEGIDDQVHEIDLELFESVTLDVAGIHIRAFLLRHSEYLVTDEETGTRYNRHEGVENLIYLIEIDGLRLLHVGDAMLSQNLEFFEEGLFPEVDVDIVFLEFFDWSDETKAILDRRMAPGHVVFMHLPPEKEKINQIRRRLASTFDNAVVFDEPGQERSF
jgi:L-ascorbate metabolism protein UlaG (beta-lactamase superfamily)